METYGSMEKREKTDFILEQFRLCMAKKDYSRAQIISRKISTKLFEDVTFGDLKLRFFNLMIQLSLQTDNYLKTCQNYRSLYDTQSVKDEETTWKQVLSNIVIFIILSPFDHEQSDLIHRINQDSNLSKVPLFRELLKSFITNELMQWSVIEQNYGAELKKFSIFDGSDSGRKHYEDLHKRVIEHNIRVISKYYQRITIKKLTVLLDLSAQVKLFPYI